MTIFSAALLLFLVMDPIGNIPLFLVTLRNYGPNRQKRIIVRELLFALAALILFLFGGHFLLKLLNISESALTMAGGIILFLIAIKMIFPATMGPPSQEIDLEGEPIYWENPLELEDLSEEELLFLEAEIKKEIKS